MCCILDPSVFSNRNTIWKETRCPFPRFHIWRRFQNLFVRKTALWFKSESFYVPRLTYKFFLNISESLCLPDNTATVGQALSLRLTNVHKDSMQLNCWWCSSGLHENCCKKLAHQITRVTYMINCSTKKISLNINSWSDTSHIEESIKNNFNYVLERILWFRWWLE